MVDEINKEERDAGLPETGIEEIAGAILKALHREGPE